MTPVDLRALFRAAGCTGYSRALMSAPPPRRDAGHPVAVLDPRPAPVTCEPLQVAGVVDGIQAAVVLTRRDRRPVYLTYTAAACVAAGITVRGLREQLAVVCSAADAAWALTLPGALPVHALAQLDPPTLDDAAADLMAAHREHAEAQVVYELVDAGAGIVLCDGSLLGRPADPGVVGVVKTAGTRYLDDESVLWTLQAGWRSGVFVLPAAAGSGGHPAPRYSTYLRLVDDPHGPWDHGLVRLETHSRELLEPLAALCLAERQSTASPDPRRDRHLAGVRAVEEYLRARRPAVFSV